MRTPLCLCFVVVPAMVAACARVADAPPAIEPAVEPQPVQPAAHQDPPPVASVAPLASTPGPAPCASASEPPSVPIPAGAKDTSVPLDAGAGYVQLRAAKTDVQDTSFCGKVERIDAKGEDRRVLLSGTAPELERSFDLRLPAKLPVPFGVGDDLAVHLRSRRIAIHRVLEGTVLDAAGRLLVGFSHDGRIEFAPGWSIDLGSVESTGQPHMPGGARRQVRTLVLARGGAVAQIPSGRWRRLTAGDTTWAVSGDAVEWTPGPRPPDASSYQQFSVIRLRTNAH